MQRWLSKLIILVVVVTYTSANAQQLTHYTYAQHSESWYDYLLVASRSFKELTGIDVEIIQSSGSASNYLEQVVVMVAGGTPPDITDFHPELGASLIEAEMFEDLRPYIERSSIDLNEYPPVAIEGVTSPSGALWGFPVSVFPVVTYYNQDLFDSVGIINPVDLGHDWTWETFRESARRLTVDRDGDGEPDQWGLDGRVINRWEQWVHQAGGTWYDRLVFPAESRLGSDEVLEGARFLTQLMHEDRAVSPRSSGYQFYAPDGVAGMTTVDGPGIIGTYLQRVSFSWDVVQQARGPVSRAARVNPDGFQILKDSRHKDAAWRWIEFLAGSEENQEMLAAMTGRIPSLRMAMLNYDRMSLELPSNWMAFIDTAFDPDGYAAYVVDRRVTDTVKNTMRHVWDGDQSPEEALQQLDSVINGLLGELNKK